MVNSNKRIKRHAFHKVLLNTRILRITVEDMFTAEICRFNTGIVLQRFVKALQKSQIDNPDLNHICFCPLVQSVGSDN
jgi:hypothetical protein